jgi:hypothetical protein
VTLVNWLPGRPNEHVPLDHAAEGMYE